MGVGYLAQLSIHSDVCSLCTVSITRLLWVSVDGGGGGGGAFIDQAAVLEAVEAEGLD